MRRPLFFEKMRLIYILICCALLSTALLWLGVYARLSRRTAALGAALSLLCSGSLLLLAVLPGNSFYGSVLTHGTVQQKQIALTFDDGPYPPYTQQLLQLLQEKNVRATFFMVGENAAAHPEIVKMVQAQGHLIALHAGYHKDLLKLDKGQLQENIIYGKDTLEEITGSYIAYMRPPHGFKDWSVLQAMDNAGLQAVNWSIIPRDWTNPGVRTIANRVCDNAAPGGIVLLHDGDSPAQTAPRLQTIESTGMIIDRLRSEGYEFVTVAELDKN